jgi:hypothetical protein
MRRLAWAVILFQLLWLNVFVPGHTRGAITVAGSDQTTADCCAATKHTSHDAPTPDQQRRCGPAIWWLVYHANVHAVRSVEICGKALFRRLMRDRQECLSY